MLLVGEGDFSYAAALKDQYPQELDIIATGLDTLDQVMTKYASSSQLCRLAGDGSNIHTLHSFDATTLDSNKSLRSLFRQRWQQRLPTRIVFNFPHTGAGIKDRARNIRAQQTMLLEFFKSVLRLYCTAQSVRSKDVVVGLRTKTMVMTKEAATKAIADPSCLHRHRQAHDDDEQASNGQHIDANMNSEDECPELHITLKEGDPYDDWNVKRLARLASNSDSSICGALEFNRSFRFDPSLVPSYRHVRTLGDMDNPNDDFESRGRTFVWNILPSLDNK